MVMASIHYGERGGGRTVRVRVRMLTDVFYLRFWVNEQPVHHTTQKPNNPETKQPRNHTTQKLDNPETKQPRTQGFTTSNFNFRGLRGEKNISLKAFFATFEDSFLNFTPNIDKERSLLKVSCDSD